MEATGNVPVASVVSVYGRAMRDRFRSLHATGSFVLPNPWDLGSARILAAMGFPALATTSAGLATAHGRLDQSVTRDELLAHVDVLASQVALPLNVDAEFGYALEPGGVAETVSLIAATPAAGCSIEDYDPATARVLSIDKATERIGAAAEVARRSGLVLTARAENHLYGAGDLDDTITRLLAYQAAGAEVVYAPGLQELGDIATLVRAVSVPVNVLAFPDGPTVGELAALGVRRVSTGSWLARVAYRALADAAGELADHGSLRCAAPHPRDQAIRDALA